MDYEKRIAVLIDADNVSEKYIKFILDEISNHGTPTYKRIYGDWTKPQLGSWKGTLLTHSITPIQQYSYTTGKNATDSALIIDTMDILYSKNVDGFCIVSSDSDFTRLAARLREAGMYVIGMGEKKTPAPFIAACEQFKYLEVLAAAAVASTVAKPSAPVPATPNKTVKNGQNGKKEKEVKEEKEEKEEFKTEQRAGLASAADITEALKVIITENSDEEGWAFLGQVGSMLTKRYPDFDTRNYGFSKLTPFIVSLKQFDIQSRRTTRSHIIQKYVRNKEK